MRLEWYLAQILAVLKAEDGKPYIWQKELIGYEPAEQTLEESLAAFESI